MDLEVGVLARIPADGEQTAGFFDERYFFFFEETDLAYNFHRRDWSVYHVPDAFIYHLQGQSIGNNARSRIEFYRSRYQFFRKWHGRPYYYLAKGIIFLRLLVNWIFSLISVSLTLGLGKKVRNKLSTYSELIHWHFQK